MATAIEFNNISKQYRLGVVSGGTIRADFQRWWQMTIRHQEDPFLKVGEINDRSVKGNSEYVWALKDIDFKVEQGDVVGIIGKNGAGKSTLLKILSKVTGPTTGTIRAKGRIGSLLEVGTGFHPEMTGRENIYLNGAILGMSKQEINRKLDEIVDFSGCERYIDTPVKRYSSGMMVRLGFSVAAHLDPEILVVDEVLAVGDAEFQKKAIGKMQSVSKGEGRTVLFVSHNMTAVKSLCHRGVLLEHGMIKKIDDIESVVSSYLCGDSGIANYKIGDQPILSKDGFELLEIGIRRKGAGYEDIMRMDEDLELVVRYRLTQPYNQFHLTFHWKNEQGNKIFSSGGGGRCIPFEHNVGEYVQTCHIPANFLNWGAYGIDLYVIKDRSQAIIVEDNIINFTLENKAKKLGTWMGKEPGSVTPKFDYFEEKQK